jgi:hypothetical protein
LCGELNVILSPGAPAEDDPDDSDEFSDAVAGDESHGDTTTGETGQMEGHDSGDGGGGWLSRSWPVF